MEGTELINNIYFYNNMYDGVDTARAIPENAFLRSHLNEH